MPDPLDDDSFQDLWNRIHEDPHRSMSRTVVENNQWLKLANQRYSAEKWQERCNKNGYGYFSLKSSSIDSDPIKVWTLQNAKRAGLRLDKKVIVLAKLCNAPFDFYLDVNDPYANIEKIPKGCVSFVIDAAKNDVTQRIQHFYNYITESKYFISRRRTKVFAQVLYRGDPNGTPVTSVPALADVVKAAFDAKAFDWRKPSLRLSFANVTDLYEYPYYGGIWLLQAHAIDLHNCDQGDADSAGYVSPGRQSLMLDLLVENRDRHAARLGYMLDACTSSLKYLRLGLHGVSPEDLNSVVQKVCQCKRTRVVKLFSSQPATVPVEEWLKGLEGLVASANDTALEQLEYCIPIKSEHGNDVPALEAWFEREYGPRVDAIMSRNLTLMTCLVMIHPQSTSSYRRRLFEGYVDRNNHRRLVLSSAKDVAKEGEWGSFEKNFGTSASQRERQPCLRDCPYLLECLVLLSRGRRATTQGQAMEA